MTKVAFSILSVNNDKDYLKKIDTAIDKGADWIHYDIMDKLFVKNTGFNEGNISTIDKECKEHFKDFHFMVNDPERYFERYKNIANSMTFHHEAVSYYEGKKMVNHYRKPTMMIGVSINPKTNIEQIYEYLFMVDFVLVMSVVPGLGGQSFIPESLEKIRRLRKYIEMMNLDCLIQVDGGINEETAKQCIEAGADILVAGSYLAKDFNNISKIKK